MSSIPRRSQSHTSRFVHIYSYSYSFLFSFSWIALSIGSFTCYLSIYLPTYLSINHEKLNIIPVLSIRLACQEKDNERPHSSPLTGEQPARCSSSREERNNSQEQQQQQQQQQLTTVQNNLKDYYSCPYHGPILQMDLNNNSNINHQQQWPQQQQQQQSMDPMTRFIHDNHPGE